MYRKILIGGATAAVIVGSGTAALALSGSDTTSGSAASSSASSSTATPGNNGKNGHGKNGHGKKGHRLLRRAVHGELTVRAKGKYVTIHLVKGTVTSVSATSIMVKSKDDTSETFGVTKDTKVRARAGGKATDSTIGAVHEGDRVLVAGPGSTKPVAKHIVDAGKK